MGIVSQIVAFLFAIFLLVTVHEYGHFWVARRFGIKAIRFSIGFGKPIWRWLGKDGTEYVIAMLPLGGYVRLVDEREGEVAEADKPFAFNRKPVWIRFLVVLAGPVTNWLLAILLFWLVYAIGIQQVKPVIGKVTPDSIAAQAGLQPEDQIISIDGHNTPNWQKAMLAVVYRLGEKGKMQVTVQSAATKQPQTLTLNLANWSVGGLTPEPLRSLGITPYTPFVPPILAKVMPGLAAANAGLQPDDQILAVDGQSQQDWVGFVEYVQKHPGKTIELMIERNHQRLTIPVIIGSKHILPWKTIGFLGVESKSVAFPASMKYQEHYSLAHAFMPAIQETATLSAFNFVIFGKMLIGRVSLKGLGGPITIYATASAAFKQGFVIYVGFLGLLSVMLACLNILPIPGLDGGHLFYFIIEAIRGRPVSVAAQVLAWRVGMIFLLLLMFQATLNDVLRLL